MAKYLPRHASAAVSQRFPPDGCPVSLSWQIISLLISTEEGKKEIVRQAMQQQGSPRRSGDPSSSVERSSPPPAVCGLAQCHCELGLLHAVAMHSLRRERKQIHSRQFPFGLSRACLGNARGPKPTNLNAKVKKIKWQDRTPHLSARRWGWQIIARPRVEDATWRTRGL